MNFEENAKAMKNFQKDSSLLLVLMLGLEFCSVLGLWLGLEVMISFRVNVRY